jgi:hypothetical protein
MCVAVAARRGTLALAFIWRTHKNTFTRAPKAAAKAYHIIFKALFSSAGNAIAMFA